MSTSDFDSLHPRGDAGKFTTKPQSAPEVGLGAPAPIAASSVPSPGDLADRIIEENYGADSDYGESNQYDESGLTLALAEGDVDADGIRAMIESAVRRDREMRDAAEGAAIDAHIHSVLERKLASASQSAEQRLETASRAYYDVALGDVRAARHRAQTAQLDYVKADLALNYPEVASARYDWDDEANKLNWPANFYDADGNIVDVDIDTEHLLDTFDSHVDAEGQFELHPDGGFLVSMRD